MGTTWRRMASQGHLGMAGTLLLPAAALCNEEVNLNKFMIKDCASLNKAVIYS